MGVGGFTDHLCFPLLSTVDVDQYDAYRLACRSVHSLLYDWFSGPIRPLLLEPLGRNALLQQTLAPRRVIL